MSRIPVIENGRRGKKRRHYTPAQRAAGFGGKKHRKSSTRKRRSYAPPTQNARRTRRSSYSYRLAAPRHRRRHRNPSGGSRGFLGGLIPGIDLKAALDVGIGVASTQIVPSLIRKFAPTLNLPSTGPTGYLVKAGSAIAVGMAAKFLLKDSARAGRIIAGGLGAVLFEAYNDYVAPQLGLSGLSGDLAMYGDLRGKVEYPFAGSAGGPRRMVAGEMGA